MLAIVFRLMLIIQRRFCITIHLDGDDHRSNMTVIDCHVVSRVGSSLQWKWRGVSAVVAGSTIGETIRRLRMQLGLSQRELARMAGVSQSLIARIESGSVNPRYETVARILNVLENVARARRLALNIASKPVVTVKLGDTLRAAFSIMDRYGFSQLPVVDSGGRVVGTVYESTILRAIVNQGVDVLDETVEKHMDAPLPMVDEKATIDDVLRLLEQSSAVLIVDAGRRPLGIVTRIDIVRSLAAHGGLQWKPRGV